MSCLHYILYAGKFKKMVNCDKRWDNTVIYQCIAIHSVAMHVSIQQSKYRYIDVLLCIAVYCCVLINELFSAMDKTLKLTLYRK